MILSGSLSFPVSLGMILSKCRKEEVLKMDYVVISPEILYQMADFFRSVIGSLFSVGIYVVVILLGLDIFLNFIHSIVD